MIYLSKMTKNDLPFLLEVRNHFSTRSMLENDRVFEIEECKEWFNKTKPHWLIILNQKKERVGYLRTNQDEVGVDIHPSHRRLGYAKAAYLEYLKEKNFASLWVFEDNHAINLYRKLGFLENGISKTIRNRKYVQMIYKK